LILEFGWRILFCSHTESNHVIEGLGLVTSRQIWPGVGLFCFGGHRGYPRRRKSKKRTRSWGVTYSM